LPSPAKPATGCWPAGHTVLAATHVTAGHPDRAIEPARAAIALHQTTGHRLGHAPTLLALGHALHHLHSPAAATAAWREALALFTDLGAQEAVEDRPSWRPGSDPTRRHRLKWINVYGPPVGVQAAAARDPDDRYGAGSVTLVVGHLV